MTRITGILGVLVIYAGIVVVGLIAAAATTRLGARLDAIWADLPGVIGFRGLAMALVYLACVVALVAGIRRASQPTLHRFMPWGGLLLLVGIRIVAIPLIETPLSPDNDPLFLHELAVGVLDGGNWLVSHRPMGYSAMLGALYAVFGIHPWLAEVLNLALATAAGWMLYRLVLGGWGDRPAAMALTLYAVLVSQILLVTTIFTEVAYSAFLLAALLVAARAVRSGRFALALVAGALLAVSQYVRPLSQAFLATFVVLPFLSGLRPSRAAALAAGMTLTFLTVLAPIAVHNVTANGSLSLATSSYGGWSVFVGANQEHTGMFNRDDQVILRATPGSVWEQSEILGRAGIARITADPRGFAELATRKFRIMWGDDTYAVGAALSGSTVSDPFREALELASQATYAAVAAAAAVGLWRIRRRPPPEAFLLAGVLVTVAAAHIFVEVQPRYHAYALPLLCALAATFLGATSASTRALDQVIQTAMPDPPRSRPLRRVASACMALVVAGGITVASTSDAAVRATQVGPFVTHPYAIADLAEPELPYRTGEVTPLEPAGIVDALGVRRFEAEDGSLHDHPVQLAQEALRLLDAYSSGAGAEYVALAELHADRLLSIAVTSRDALYFPYSFPFALHGKNSDVMLAPWYSAMAQGQALSVFVRLYEATGNVGYRWAADDTFASFIAPRLDDGSPWTVFVDDAGYLWLEEYPKDPPMRVLNGHLFAAFGLYDYFRLTGRDDVRALLRGALTTVEHYGLEFRNPGGISRYCLRFEVHGIAYHAVHVEQLRHAAAISGDTFFADLADLFVMDHDPERGAPG